MKKLIDADALERDGWQMRRTVRISKDEMELQIRKPTDFPTIEPQRMRGRWIEDGYNDEKAVCDQCGEPCATYIMGEPRDKYCKWCGAEMRGTE